MSAHQESLFAAKAMPPTSRPAHIGVMTWNVQHAAPARAWRQATWASGHEQADVIVLTEVQLGSSAVTTAAALMELGYDVQSAPATDRDYGVAIATRLGTLDVLDAVTTSYLPHRCLIVQISGLDGVWLTIGGLYVPSRGPRDKRNVAKRAFQDAVVELLPTLAALAAAKPHVPLILAGDLNVVERDHEPHHTVFGAWEYEFYEAFAATGFADCYRRAHPESSDHSWFGRSGAGFRFDHLFISSAHSVASVGCTYVHEPRERGLSDHSALITTVRTPVRS